MAYTLPVIIFGTGSDWSTSADVCICKWSFGQVPLYVGNCLSVMFPKLAKYFDTSLLDRDDVANFSKAVEIAIIEGRNAELVISHNIACLLSIVLI